MKLAIATPIYGGQVAEAYHDSLIELLFLLDQHRIPTVRLKLPNSCYIAWARNVYATHLLETDCTHLLFLDSDMGWNSRDVLKMLAYADKPEYGVIGAAYRHKSLNWQQIRDAVVRNPQIEPDALPNLGAKWTFYGLPPGEHDLAKPVEVSDFVPTGILSIRREVFETLKSKLPILTEGQYKSAVFFDARYQLIHQQYIGEDVYFCRLWRKHGGKVWLAPWVRSTHVGQFAFPTDIAAIIEAGEEIES